MAPIRTAVHPASAGVADVAVRTPSRPKARKGFWPKTRLGWVFVGAFVVMIAAVLFAAFGTRPFGWIPIGGLSMEPTIHQPVYLPFGDPTTRHRGAFVHINKTDRSLKPGDIFLFSHNGGEDVKRVEKVRKDGAVWVTPDNIGVTGMDSREYGWIPANDIVGVVDQIWTPRHAWRSATPEGRFRNWVEFTYPPTVGVVSWSLDGGHIAVQDDDQVKIIRSPDRRLVMTRDGTCLGWEEGRFLLVTPDPPQLLSVTPIGEEKRVIVEPTSTSAAIIPSTSTTLGLEGWVDVEVGQEVVFPGRSGLSVQVTGVSWRRAGCQGGIATYVDVAPPIVPPPETMGEPIEVR